MIAKTYFSAKVFCEYTVKNLRQEKSLRDHEPYLSALRQLRAGLRAGKCAKWGSWCACGW
jgi:hypothetical protein